MSQQSIRAHSKIERLETKMNELNEFLSESEDLPRTVVEAVALKQDQLMNEVSSLLSEIGVDEQ